MSERTAASRGSEPIIFLDDICVTFKTRTGSLFKPNLVHAVNHVTLKLMPGETIGIVGESGCGKSTTANVMCGLQSPTSGKVFFKGVDVTKRTAEIRKKIGRVVSVVFQNPATALNPRMSVHDQLLDPLIVHKVGTEDEREARVKELIGLGIVDETFITSVFMREEMSPTSFFGLFAIPHALEMSAARTMVAVLLSERGVKWGNETVHIVLMIAVCREDRKRTFH